LKQAASDCKSPTEYGSSSWGYHVSSLPFLGYEPSNDLRPKSAKENALYLEIELKIAGSCDRLEESSKDPLHKLEFDLLVWGRNEDRHLLSAWHLDRHIFEKGDSMYSDHPRYHFQFGGERLWGEVGDYGDLLVPEPPRIAFPPMDAILAVNFVLANYFGDEWKRLVDDEEGEDEYRDLVVDAQKRLWRPYSRALSSAWQSGPYDDLAWSPDTIWPQLIDDYTGID
jgi:hypothetical protein